MRAVPHQPYNQTTMHTTRVLFRVYKDQTRELMAVFADQVRATPDGLMYDVLTFAEGLSQAQHQHIYAKTRPATPDEYKPMYAFLTDRNETVKVITRRTKKTR